MWRKEAVLAGAGRCLGHLLKGGRFREEPGVRPVPRIGKHCSPSQDCLAGCCSAHILMILVGFVTDEPQWELLTSMLLTTLVLASSSARSWCLFTLENEHLCIFICQQWTLPLNDGSIEVSSVINTFQTTALVLHPVLDGTGNYNGLVLLYLEQLKTSQTLGSGNAEWGGDRYWVRKSEACVCVLGH